MSEKQNYHSEYYKNNKEHMKENMNKLKHKHVFCEICKKNVKYFSMSTHRKTKKHNERLQTWNDDKITEDKIVKILRKLIDF